MSVAEFRGDEVSAAGYRLCGVDVHIADHSNALSLIEQACESASLVLIGSNTAARLDSTELERLRKNIKPPVLIVDDMVSDMGTLPEIRRLIHKQLGMLE